MRNAAAPRVKVALGPVKQQPRQARPRRAWLRVVIETWITIKTSPFLRFPIPLVGFESLHLDPISPDTPHHSITISPRWLPFLNG
jgi:hypothetical protein